MSKYLPTIGIECHVQLNTKTKLFAAVNNDARLASPNTTVSPICFGLPGVLPVLNVEAVQLAIRAGHALNAEVAGRSVFDRKHYFYPDLPKGYQISQYHHPIVGKGKVLVQVDGETKVIGITRAHLEEDAGKLIHTKGVDYSLVDLNRAGTPLLEIVSEPDMHNSKEAKTFAQELYLLMTYAGVTDGDLYHGNMRFDVNVSLSPVGSSQLGIRAEIKNLNSFRSVEKAVEFEIARQSALLDKGEAVVQETRGWDDDKQKTQSLRSKEDAHDYRYFADPDIPPVILSEREIAKQKELLPVMPDERRSSFKTLGINHQQIENLISKKELGDVLLMVSSKAPEGAKRAANLLAGVVSKEMSNNPEMAVIDAERLLEIIVKIDKGELNSNAVDKLVALAMADPVTSIAELAKANGLEQVNDETQLGEIVDRILIDNPQVVQDILSGETKAIGFLVGKVMAATYGQASPQTVNKLIDLKISKS